MEFNKMPLFHGIKPPKELDGIKYIFLFFNKFHLYLWRRALNGWISPPPHCKISEIYPRNLVFPIFILPCVPTAHSQELARLLSLSLLLSHLALHLWCGHSFTGINVSLHIFSLEHVHVKWHLIVKHGDWLPSQGIQAFRPRKKRWAGREPHLCIPEVTLARCL